MWRTSKRKFLFAREASKTKIKKMKYRNTKRNGALLTLLSLVTLTISSVFVYSRVGKEIEAFSKKKSMNYFLCWLLGFITLGIAPLLWQARRMDEIKAEADSLSININGSFEKLFNWKFFGFFILIGPFLANHYFFASLNRVEMEINKMPSVEVEDGATGVVTSSPILKEEPKPLEEEKEEPKEAAPAVASTSRTVTRVTSFHRPPRIFYEAGSQKVESKGWTVRVKGESPVTFSSQQQAIAYAKKAAEKDGVNVRVKAKSKA